MFSKTLVLDAMGVIYQACDDVAELLIPFAREHGSSLSDEEITQHYVDCSLGKISDAEFWERLGVSGPTHVINARYLIRHQLNPELRPFLDDLRALNIQVGCISNDVSEWSRALRQHFGIEQLFLDWTISGDVHIRKPDAGIYMHFLNTNSLLAGECVFVDDRVKNLDGARRLGFETIYYAHANANQDAGPHAVITSLSELKRWLA